MSKTERIVSNRMVWIVFALIGVGSSPLLAGEPYPGEPYPLDSTRRVPSRCFELGMRPSRLPNRSIHWSMPRLGDTSFSTCQPRARDVWDRFYDFRLVPYQRTDNGYVGPNRDCLGRLGQSRAAGQPDSFILPPPGTNPLDPGRRFR